jgi:hypothetical protein
MQGLTPQFLSLLTNLLYTQPLLLSPLLRALSQLVQSTQRLATSATTPEELRKQFGIDQAQATANIAYLKTLAKDMVSVLLNVFSKLPRDQRGQVGEVISAWVGIMSEAVSRDCGLAEARLTRRTSSRCTKPSRRICPAHSRRRSPLRQARAPRVTRCSTCSSSSSRTCPRRN